MMMNMKARINLVRAMDTIVRSLNDETVIDRWLTCGVADGDSNLPDQDLETYCEDDDDFRDLINLFKRCVSSSEIYCNGVLSL